MRDVICLRVFELSLDRDRDVVENTSLQHVSNEEMELASLATLMNTTYSKDNEEAANEDVNSSANTTLEGSIPDDLLDEIIAQAKQANNDDEDDEI